MWLKLLFLLHAAPLQADDTDWVKIGESFFPWEFTYPYQLSLWTPKGVHDIDDIKGGLQTVRFEVKWLAPASEQSLIQKHFKTLINGALRDAESRKFNEYTIDKLLQELPASRRNDVWVFLYLPDAGTHILIDGKIVHKIIGAELNRALYSAWLDKDPVIRTRLLKRLLQ